MEAALLLGLQAIRVNGLNQVMALISALGNQAFIWFVIAIVMLVFAEKRKVGVLIIISIVVAFILTQLVIGPLVGRAHPNATVSGLTALMGVSKAGWSFPSWHATSSFAAATVLLLTYGRKAGMSAFVLAILISFSRLYCGVEYLTDILAGAIIGAFIGFMVIFIFTRFFGDTRKERFTPKGRHSL